MYMGEQESSDIFKIEAYSYNEDICSVNTFYNTKDALSAIKDDQYIWFNVTGLGNIKEIAELGKFASIHNLFLEDILDTDHRPKIEVLNNEILIILKMLTNI